jgi:hypothetical protein
MDPSAGETTALAAPRVDRKSSYSPPVPKLARRFVLLAPLLLGPACAASPAPPIAGQAASAAPKAPADACEALDKPLGTLRRLASLVSLGRSMPARPLYPDRFVAELEADAARATAAPPEDAAVAKLAADAGARLTSIAAAARALAAKRDGDAEPARVALLEQMERGELVVLLGDERCGKSAAGRHSAKALESTVGRIPAAALQRAIRAGSDAFRKCQESGLRRDPSRRGVVRVRFVVGPDGSVREAADAAREPPDPLAWSTAASAQPLRDPAVSACVIDAFRKLVFPKPEGGAFQTTWSIELGAR